MSDRSQLLNLKSHFPELTGFLLMRGALYTLLGQDMYPVYVYLINSFFLLEFYIRNVFLQKLL